MVVRLDRSHAWENVLGGEWSGRELALFSRVLAAAVRRGRRTGQEGIYYADWQLKSTDTVHLSRLTLVAFWGVRRLRVYSTPFLHAFGYEPQR